MGRAAMSPREMLRGLHREGREASATYRATWPLPSFRRADARPLVAGEPARLRCCQRPGRSRPGTGSALPLAGADRDSIALWPYGRPGLWRIGTGPGGSTVTMPLLRPGL